MVQVFKNRYTREGKWNGGFAPYGYALVDGKLEINEEEAVAIRTIFDQYVNTDMGSNGITKYLENHGILDKMYEPMNEAERREFLTQFIEKVEIYEEEQENGQWLKSIEFKLPIISKDMKISLDNGSHIETIVLITRGKQKEG